MYDQMQSNYFEGSSNADSAYDGSACQSNADVYANESPNAASDRTDSFDCSAKCWLWMQQ